MRGKALFLCTVGSNLKRASGSIPRSDSSPSCVRAPPAGPLFSNTEESKAEAQMQNTVGLGREMAHFLDKWEVICEQYHPVSQASHYPSELQLLLIVIH